MKKILKWGGIAFVVLIIIGAISSAGSGNPEKVGSNETSSNTSQTEPEKGKTKVFKIGDSVNLDGKTVTVNEVKPYTSKNQFLVPEPGNKFVALDITLRNDSDEAYNYNVLEFKLQDNQDYSYTNAVADIEPYLATGAIQQGQSARGFIAYEIPSENEPVKLIYTPSFWGTSQIIVELE